MEIETKNRNFPSPSYSDVLESGSLISVKIRIFRRFFWQWYRRNCGTVEYVTLVVCPPNFVGPKVHIQARSVPNMVMVSRMGAPAAAAEKISGFCQKRPSEVSLRFYRSNLSCRNISKNRAHSLLFNLTLSPLTSWLKTHLQKHCTIIASFCDSKILEHLWALENSSYKTKKSRYFWKSQ